MNVTIVGRKCTPRESFKERAERKLAKIDKFFGSEADAKVIATVEKKYKTVEITLKQGGMLYRAQEKAPELEDALDKCVDTLIRQIRKNKTRLEKKLKSGSIDDIIAAEEPVEEELEYEIVRTKSVAVKPQSVEEAILQMNMLGHDFYLFRNATTEAVNVVYKREGGGYGILEPTDEAEE